MLETWGNAVLVNGVKIGDPSGPVAHVGQGLVGEGRMTELQMPQSAAHTPLATEVIIVVEVVPERLQPEIVEEHVVEQSMDCEPTPEFVLHMTLHCLANVAAEQDADANDVVSVHSFDDFPSVLSSDRSSISACRSLSVDEMTSILLTLISSLSSVMVQKMFCKRSGNDSNWFSLSDSFCEQSISPESGFSSANRFWTSCLTVSKVSIAFVATAGDGSLIHDWMMGTKPTTSVETWPALD